MEVGIVCGFISFLISFNTTTHILRCMTDNDITNIRNVNNISNITNNNNKNNSNNYIDNINKTYNSNNRNLLINKDSTKGKVKFHNGVSYIIIPSIHDLSANNLKELWYSGDDYYNFKLEYIKKNVNDKED